MIEATVHEDPHIGVLYSHTNPWQAAPEGMQPFKYTGTYLPKNSTTEYIVYCYNRADFLRLVKLWDRIMPQVWRYAVVEEKGEANE